MDNLGLFRDMRAGAARYTTILPTMLALIQWAIDPFLTVGAGFLLLHYFNIPVNDHYIHLAIVVFLLALLIFRQIDLFSSWASGDVRAQTSNLMISWAMMILVLVFLGYITDSIDLFDKMVLFTWAWITPIIILAVHFVIRKLLLFSLRFEKHRRNVVIVGMNDQARRLAHDICKDEGNGLSLKGFFDDRNEERIGYCEQANYLGKMDALVNYVSNNNIDLIYITLPVRDQQRVLDLLDALHDTTASIYFTPDIFVYDLIQSRMDSIGDTPLVALCETPFSGTNGIIKRLSDILFSSAILILISPILLILAIAVKLSSKGPVFFKQKRYGLDGDEITVYKFRSMTVCENDSKDIKQATRNDSRVTKLGAILRRYSLDELPQFLNVLQGRMSTVGPRPHAVAHNELYRGQIKGYMIRHKVKPGITGWAQVNGYRGETDTVEKMQKRVEYDLDYLRNWSLGLDFMIVFKTLFAVFQNDDTY